MTWGAVAGAVAGPLIGGLMSGGAADAQSAGADRAAELQMQQYKETAARLAPFVGTGTRANNKLEFLLGLGGGSGGTSEQQFREQLLPQFTRQSTTPGREVAYTTTDDTGHYTIFKDGTREEGYGDYGPTTQSTIDESGLSAAIQQAMSQQQQSDAAAMTDPDFGSLLKKYTGKDLVNEPGYQFRLSEGQKGVERSAAGRGGLFSGQAGKELLRYGQGFASNEYQNAFNRDASQKNQIYGMLSGTAGAGQNAAAMTGTAGAGAAANAGNYITQGANAQAAGMVGTANAINSGISNYQNYNMLNSIFNKTAQTGGSSAYDPVAGYGRGYGGAGD